MAASTGSMTWDEAVSDNTMVEALSTASSAAGGAGDGWYPKGTVIIAKEIHIIECGDISTNLAFFLEQHNDLRSAIRDSIRASLPVAQATTFLGDQISAGVLLQQCVQQCSIVVQVVLAIPGKILVDCESAIPRSKFV